MTVFILNFMHPAFVKKIFQFPLTVILIFSVALTACNRKNLWENEYSVDNQDDQVNQDNPAIIPYDVTITDVIADNAGNTITLQWTEPEGDYTQIRVSYTGGASGDEYMDPSPSGNGDYTLSSASPGSVYTFTIRTSDGVDESAGVTQNAACGIYFVATSGASGSGGGWFNFAAYGDPQAAAQDASANGMAYVWIQGGHYYPSSSVNITDNLEISGGFSGNENSKSSRALSDRDGNGTVEPWEFTSETIIDGDTGSDDSFNTEPSGSGAEATSSDGFRIVGGTNLECVITSAGAVGATAVIDGITITGGNSSSQGGGISLIYSGSSPAIYNCSFRNNNASSGGAACLSGNSGSLFSGCKFDHNYASSAGGAVEMDLSNSITFSDSLFTNNAAIGNGGAISAENITTGGNNYQNVAFVNNEATQSGGAIFTDNATAESGFTGNCVFNGNTAGQNGGAIYEIAGCNSVHNSSAFTGNSSGNSGGAVYLEDAVGGKYNYCDFNNNTALFSGGAFYNYGGSGVLFYYTGFTQNTATSSTLGNGGAVYAGDVTGQEYINVTFQGNEAYGTNGTDGGGAIYSSDSTATYTNTTFQDNFASHYGGAIYSVNSSGNAYTGCTFNNNNAQRGGAIYKDNTTDETFSGCEFQYNMATEYGGAISILNGKMAVRNSSFTENSTLNYDGGAINWDINTTAATAQLMIINSLFDSNATPAGGSAIKIHNYAPTTSPTMPYTLIMNSIFISNYVSSNNTIGGAIYVRDDAGYNGQHYFYLVNSLLYGNDSINDTTPSGLVFSTLDARTTTYLFNTILWNNYRGNDVYGTPGDPAYTSYQVLELNDRSISHNFQNSIIDDGQADAAVAYPTDITGNAYTTDYDPEFSDTSVFDFHIASTSPAYNYGDGLAFNELALCNSSLSVDINDDGLYQDYLLMNNFITDFDRNPRLMYNYVDIGPYEVQ